MASASLLAAILAWGATDYCAATADPTLCQIERAADTGEPLPPLPCHVPCDTDSRCEEQAIRCETPALNLRSLADMLDSLRRGETHFRGCPWTDSVSFPSPSEILADAREGME